MKKPVKFGGQALFYMLFAGVVWYFSHLPTYHRFPAGDALMKLSLTHAGDRKVPCRKISREEMLTLPRAQRRPPKCARERWPVRLEVEVDGEPVFAATKSPAGLSKDGVSTFYERVRLPAGQHTVKARLRIRGSEGFDYEREETLVLAPLQVFVVDFNPDREGLVFR